MILHEWPIRLVWRAVNSIMQKSWIAVWEDDRMKKRGDDDRVLGQQWLNYLLITYCRSPVMPKEKKGLTFEPLNLSTSPSNIWICSLIKPRHTVGSSKYEQGIHHLM